MEIVYLVLNWLAGLCLGLYVGRAFRRADEVIQAAREQTTPPPAEKQRAAAWLHRFDDTEDK